MSDSAVGDSGAPVVRRPHRGGGRRLTVVAAVLAGLGVAALVVALVVEAGSATEEPAALPAAAQLGTDLLSARRAPGWTTELVGSRALAAAVQPVADAAPPNTCIGVGNGTSTVYAHNPDAPLVPASNQKLVTGAAALGILGPETTLDTLVAAATAPVGGVLSGDLYLVGGGDPLLTTDGYQKRFTRGRMPETDLEGVADEMVASGLAQVTGSVVGDATRYDSQRTGPGWPQRWLTNGTVAPLSALTVNDALLVDPTTGEGPCGAADDPALHAAGVLTQLLIERGVVVAGAPLAGRAPDGTPSLLSVPSLPVAVLVEQMLTFSDNTTAELLVKEIGRVSAGEGSTAAGTAAVTQWAQAEGFDAEGAAVGDGSGLSSSNRLTCELIANVLRSEGSNGFLAGGLAVPGQPGTLYDRFPGGEMAMRLRAKTGTLNNSTSLSGWLLSRPGATLDFQIVTNTDGRAVTAADTALQALLAAALLDQPLSPPLDQAGPLPVAGS